MCTCDPGYNGELCDNGTFLKIRVQCTCVTVSARRTFFIFDTSLTHLYPHPYHSLDHTITLTTAHPHVLSHSPTPSHPHISHSSHISHTSHTSHSSHTSHTSHTYRGGAILPASNNRRTCDSVHRDPGNDNLHVRRGGEPPAHDRMAPRWRHH